MKKYNLSAIMKRAWEIKKENERNIFSLCLKMAWEEEKELISSKNIPSGGGQLEKGNIMEKMTMEQLIKRYDIKLEEVFDAKKEAYVITGRIAVHNENLAKKDNMVHEIMDRKQEIVEYLKEIKEAEKRAFEERERSIESIEGLKEIKDAMYDLEKWHQEFNKSFDDVGGLGVRPKPEYDFDAMYERYPVAKAYLDAYNYSIKRNYELAAIGDKALERIINNHDEYREAIEEMKKDLDEFANRHAWD